MGKKAPIVTQKIKKTSENHKTQKLEKFQIKMFEYSTVNTGVGKSRSVVERT